MCKSRTGRLTRRSPSIIFSNKRNDERSLELKKEKEEQKVSKKKSKNENECLACFLLEIELLQLSILENWAEMLENPCLEWIISMLQHFLQFLSSSS